MTHGIFFKVGSWFYNHGLMHGNFKKNSPHFLPSSIHSYGKKNTIFILLKSYFYDLEDPPSSK